MWETLPSWFWIVYYLFLLATLACTIFCALKGKMKSLSMVIILLVIFVPIVSLLNSIGRAEGMNEFNHLWSQLQQGALWSVFVSLGYMLMVLWWALFLFKNKPISER